MAEIATKSDEGVGLACWSTAGALRDNECVMEIESMPKSDEGKAPLRGQVRGSVCRKKKNFTKVMVFLFAQGRWADLSKGS